ncbi:MAG TPA: hypothetical protein VI669_18975 [Vicinamibacteria bacterium]
MQGCRAHPAKGGCAWPLAVSLLLTFLVSAPGALAQEESLNISFGGLLDVRAIRTDRTQSWFDGGLGKTRYGGVDGERATLFRLAGASVLLTAATSEVLSASVQVNIDAHPDNRSGRRPVDLATAIVSYRPELSPHWRLRVRAGIMFPPVSLEHDGKAWSTTRTITPSAANSWMGEEVRTTGVEAALAWKKDQTDVSLVGSAFGGNDAAGTLLAFRGWSLHDRVSGYGDQLPLVALPVIQPDEEAPQAQWSQPFTEIDGRLGYYVGAQWKRDGVFNLNGLYYDNRGNENGFDGFQWAWKTTFANVGLRIHLPHGIEILAQHMWGRTSEIYYDGAAEVQAPFRTTFGMVSVPMGRSRVSLRYETFAADSEGASQLDPTDEQGRAWTAAYLLNIGASHRFALELLRVVSDRPDRAVIGFPVHAVELAAQASFQFHF